MGALVRIRDWIQKRSTSRDQQFWKKFDSAFQLATQAGMQVSLEGALGHSPSSASIRLLAETEASLPLHLYRRIEKNGIESRVLARDHWLWPLLTRRPNRYQTSYEFREQMMVDLLTSGNAFAQKIMTGSGKILELLPMPPSTVITNILADGSIVYEYRPEAAEIPFSAGVTVNDLRRAREMSQDEVWHLKDLSRNTITGLSRVASCKESIGTSMAIEKFGSQFFSNGAVPGSIAKHKGRLSKEARTNLKESINEFIRTKRHGVMLLEEGLEFEALELSNEANQFLQTREFQVEDISRIWRVPGFLIGNPGRSIALGNAEQQVTSFVTFSLRSWLVRVEQSINMNLIPEAEQDTYFVAHKMDELLRGDMATRFHAYQLARQGEWMNPNEIRAAENMNPRDDEGGDDYTNPNVKSPIAGRPPTE